MAILDSSSLCIYGCNRLVSVHGNDFDGAAWGAISYPARQPALRICTQWLKMAKDGSTLRNSAKNGVSSLACRITVATLGSTLQKMTFFDVFWLLRR